jgi:hypothetical protein
MARARVSSIIFRTKRRLHLQIDRTGDITELTRRVQTLQETIVSTVRISIPCTERTIHIIYFPRILSFQKRSC